MQDLTRLVLPGFISAFMLFAACTSTSTSTSTPPPTTIRTHYALTPEHPGFRNILVVGVAGDFASRALFERELATAITTEQVSAAAYYTLVGRRPQLTRTTLQTAIKARKFDAVLLTRLKGQEQQALAPMRPVGSAFDLFGYDYHELNVDYPLNQAKAITFVTEVYSTASQKKLWSIDSLSFEKATAVELVSEQALTVATQLRNDGVLKR